jgi:phage repressor protein C with HTH and peptisase S24 domain
MIENQPPLAHYQAFVMHGDMMEPAIKQGDYVVVDTTQRFIRSGDMYVISYQNDTIICRLLLDMDTIKIIFDGSDYEVEAKVDNITVVGRIIETKTLE